MSVQLGNLQEDDEFFAHYGIRLIASMTREFAGIGITTYFALQRWIQLIGIRTPGIHPLHSMQIAKIRGRLTISQAETAEDKERDSNVLATMEDYLQAFDFVKVLLSVRVTLLLARGILAC